VGKSFGSAPKCDRRPRSSPLRRREEGRIFQENLRGLLRSPTGSKEGQSIEFPRGSGLFAIPEYLGREGTRGKVTTTTPWIALDRQGNRKRGRPPQGRAEEREAANGDGHQKTQKKEREEELARNFGTDRRQFCSEEKKRGLYARESCWVRGKTGWFRAERGEMSNLAVNPKKRDVRRSRERMRGRKVQEEDCGGSWVDQRKGGSAVFRTWGGVLVGESPDGAPPRPVQESHGEKGKASGQKGTASPGGLHAHFTRGPRGNPGGGFGPGGVRTAPEDN